MSAGHWRPSCSTDLRALRSIGNLPPCSAVEGLAVSRDPVERSRVSQTTCGSSFQNNTTTYNSHAENSENYIWESGGKTAADTQQNSFKGLSFIC